MAKSSNGDSGTTQFKELASVETGNGVWKIQKFCTEYGKTHYGLRQPCKSSKARARAYKQRVHCPVT